MLTNMVNYNNQFDLSSIYLGIILLSWNYFLLNQCYDINTYFKEGSTGVLQCPYKSDDLSLIWMKGKRLKLISSNNHIVLKDQQHKLTIIGNHSIGVFHLAIHNFSANDQGLYRCQGITEQAAFAADIMAVLAIPPSDIRIANKTERNTIELFEGRNSEITCLVSSGIPIAQIVLNIDGKDVKNESNDFVSFQLIATKRMHLKPITCTASQSFLENPIEDAAVLFVYMGPDIHIEAKPSADILEGESIVLECIDNSNVPSKNYSWELNGSFLTNATSNVLEMNGITKSDSGIYECRVKNMIGCSDSMITVNVYHRPYLLGNSSSSLNYKTEVGGRVLVSIPVESNPEPVTVSCLNITDLKLDEWIIKKNAVGRNVFLLSTTLFPIRTAQYGAYLILVRNQYGSLKIQINLKLPDVNVTILPPYPLCDVSENLTLSCTLHQRNFHLWTNSWSHWINGNHIRNLSGIIKGNTSFLYFPFCDYQDFGEYKCSWVLQNRHGVSLVFVSVNAVPVKTDYRMWIKDKDITLVVDIFSREPIHSVDWYENGLIISNTTEKFESFMRITDIVLSVYKQHLTISGFQVGLKIRNTNYSENVVYICQIKNEYGSTDMYFEVDQLLQKTIAFEDITTISDLSTRLEKSINGSFYYIVYQNIYFVTAGFVFICVVITICSIICCIKKGRKKLTIGKQNESNVTGQQQSSQDINDSDYAEIESDIYHSVEWRACPLDISISPILTKTDQSPVSTRCKKNFEDQTNVYLDVTDDAESLTGEETTKATENTCAFGDSSSSNTIASLYIQPSIKNILNEADKLRNSENDICEVVTSNDNCYESTKSPRVSAGFFFNLSSSNTQVALSSEEDEFEDKMSAENKELCENNTKGQRLRNNLNYEKLTIFQRETNPYDQ